MTRRTTKTAVVPVAVYRVEQKPVDDVSTAGGTALTTSCRRITGKTTIRWTVRRIPLISGSIRVGYDDVE